MPVALEDGVLVYGHDEHALDLRSVAELPVFEAEYPPAQTLDPVEALDFGGNWTSEHPAIEVPNAGTGVFYSLVPGEVTGGVTLDLEAGTISGEVVAEYSCESGRCLHPDHRASGTATLTFSDGTLSGRPGLWDHVGTVDLDLAWRARTECTDGTCRWPYNTSMESSTPGG